MNFPLTMRTMKTLFVFILTSLSVYSCKAMDDDKKNHLTRLAQEANRYLEAAADQKEFAGSVIIADDDTIILRKGYGEANAESSNTPATRFCIGSITKSFTAVLVLLLAQERIINLDDPVQKYIPEFIHEDVTIHHLLTMTSGLPRDFWNKESPHFSLFKKLETAWGFEYLVDAEDSFRSLNALYTVPLESLPGEKFSYSNIGFVLLGELVRRVDHYDSYEESLQRRILIPLKLTATSVCSSEDDQLFAQRIVPPVMFEGEDNYGGSFDYGTIHTGGSMVSTVDDIYQWARNLNRLGEPLLLDDRHDHVMKYPAFGSRYCGIGTNNLDNKIIRGHDGSIGIFSTEMAIYEYDNTAALNGGRNKTLTIIVLANHGNANIVTEKICRLFDGKNITVSNSLKQTIKHDLFSDFVGTYTCDAMPGFQAVVRINKSHQLTLTTNDEDNTCVVLLKKEENNQEIFGSNLYGFTFSFHRNLDDKNVTGATLTSDDFGTIVFKKN